jgi:hypothetical protein
MVAQRADCQVHMRMASVGVQDEDIVVPIPKRLPGEIPSRVAQR